MTLNTKAVVCPFPCSSFRPGVSTGAWKKDPDKEERKTAR